MRLILTRLVSIAMIAFISAIALSFGCKHRNLGPLAPIEVPGVPTGGDGIDKRVMTASVLTIGFHYLEIKFSSYMDDETVNWRVTDENGVEVTGIEESWSPEGSILRMRGPFAFCRTYTLTIFAGASDLSGLVLESNLDLQAAIGQNPYDVDQSGSCTADVTASPFTEGLDAALLTGDAIWESGGAVVKRRADIDTARTFYFDGSGYDDADSTIRVPKTSGAAGLAKLMSWNQYGVNNELVATHYALNIWDAYDTVLDSPTASIYQVLGAATGITLHGPVAADLNGDGITDLLVSAEIPYADGSVQQKVYVIQGPFATGQRPLVNFASATIGSQGEAFSPPLAAGDFDGDGKDDFAMIYNSVSASGQPYDWGVWVFKGNDDINSVLVNPAIEKIRGRSGRTIVDLNAGDFNGDGKSDMLVAEMEEKSVRGVYHSLRPHVNIFLGGETFDGRITLDPDSDLYVMTDWDTYVNVASIGDFDGDARDDIALFVEERDLRNRIVMSKIYVFSGRVDWYEGYYLNSWGTKFASMEIDCLGMGLVHLKDNVNDPLAGDIDNDGYYDLMVTADDGTNNIAYWFFGKDGYRVPGWEFVLDSADVIWTFRP